MPLIDLAVNTINEKGWLALSSLYFDNSLVLKVYASRGYIAYSPTEKMFYTIGILDTTDTAVVENTYALLDNRYHIGQQQAITCAGEEHLQHIDLALYSNYNFYSDVQEKVPVPTIPTKDEIMGLTMNPDTGLYDGTDTVMKLDNIPESTIGMYPKDFKCYSGAWIKHWQRFYKNQAKFVEFLSTYLGVYDAI